MNVDVQTWIRRPTRRRVLILVVNVLLTSLGYFTATAIVADFAMTHVVLTRFVATLPVVALTRLLLTHQFRLDRGYWQHVGLRDLLRLAGSATLGSVLVPLVLLLVGPWPGIPAPVFVVEWMLAIGLTGGVRVLARTLHERSGGQPATLGQRAFLIGAGETGEQILRQLQHHRQHRIEVVGLIDDDAEKRGWLLHGVPVLGTVDELRGLATVHGDVALALVAVPSATPEQLRRIVTRCLEAGIVARTLPLLKHLVTEDIRLNHFREIEVQDLLGREPVTFDLQAVERDIAGKVVVISGAAGSIGSELARQVARFHPQRLLLIDRAESPLYFTHLEVSQACPDVQVVPVLASVTNARRMHRVFETHRPDWVFHAAAYKHVPLLEDSVVEGVWNNVLGTLRLARCAARVRTARFVLISTDKAANPASVLGATKLVAERVVLELPSLRSSATDFRVVRFGNVLGSEGSVVPLFQRQLAAGGPLTVTHPQVRRFLMTIPEAVQLVLQASGLPEAAGRIALLEMGREVRIAELAEQLIRLAGLVPHQDVQIVYTGLRPGEKLREQLIGDGETARATSVAKIHLVERDVSAVASLARRLRDLAHATAERDEDAMVRALAALAPGYRARLPFRLQPMERLAAPADFAVAEAESLRTGTYDRP